MTPNAFRFWRWVKWWRWTPGPIRSIAIRRVDAWHDERSIGPPKPASERAE